MEEATTNIQNDYSYLPFHIYLQQWEFWVVFYLNLLQLIVLNLVDCFKHRHFQVRANTFLF